MSAKPKRGKQPGSGRKAGTPNKVTASVKAALVAAFDELGGVAALVEWGRKKPGEFYALWGRMLPAELKVTGAPPPVALTIVEQVVAAADPPAPPPGPVA